VTVPPLQAQRRAGLEPTGSRVLSGRVECAGCAGEIQVIVYEIDPARPSAEQIRGIAWIREPWRFRIDGLPDSAALTISARWDPEGTVIRGAPVAGTRISTPLAVPDATRPAGELVVDLNAAVDFSLMGADGTDRPSGPPLPPEPTERPGGEASEAWTMGEDASHQGASISRSPLRDVSGRVVCDVCGGRVAVFLSTVPTLDPQGAEVVDQVFIDSRREFVFRDVPANRRIYLGARWDADGEPGPGLPGPNDLSTSIVITPLPPGEEAETLEVVLKTR